MRMIVVGLFVFGLSSAHAAAPASSPVAKPAVADGACGPAAPGAAPAVDRSRPPAPAAAEQKPTPTARVLPGAFLRGSPTLTTPDAQPVPNGSTAYLKAPFRNNDGAWWYVGIKGMGPGWLRFSELTDFTAAPVAPAVPSAPAPR